MVGAASLSVLLEALSVVLRAATLDALDTTAPDLYGRIITNGTFRADGRLAAVSFRSPHDVFLDRDSGEEVFIERPE